VAEDFPEKVVIPAATIYLYPAATTANAQPIYLVVDEQGQLNDLGKLVSRGAGRLSPGSQFEIVFDLSYPSQEVSVGAKGGGANPDDF